MRGEAVTDLSQPETLPAKKFNSFRCANISLDLFAFSVSKHKQNRDAQSPHDNLCTNGESRKSVNVFSAQNSA